jgi:hypothetical protein
MGLSLTIEGPTALFREVFGVSREALEGATPTTELKLPPPKALTPLIEELVISSPPEFFK